MWLTNVHYCMLNNPFPEISSADNPLFRVIDGEIMIIAERNVASQKLIADGKQISVQIFPELLYFILSGFAPLSFPKSKELSLFTLNLPKNIRFWATLTA